MARMALTERPRRSDQEMNDQGIEFLIRYHLMTQQLTQRSDLAWSKETLFANKQEIPRYKGLLAMTIPENQLNRGLFTARILKEKHLGRCCKM